MIDLEEEYLCDYRTYKNFTAEQNTLRWVISSDSEFFKKKDIIIVMLRIINEILGGK